MKLDSAGLQVLSPAECVELLATTPIGRVVFTDHALPAVQPVNFVLDGMAGGDAHHGRFQARRGRAQHCRRVRDR